MVLPPGAETLAGELVRAHTHEQLENAVAIRGRGAVNDVYTLTCVSGRKLLLRMNAAGEVSRFVKERWCIHEAALAGVPTAEVLAVGEVGVRAYMLLTYLEGHSGDELASMDVLVLWRQLGVHARRIHEIVLAGFGEELTDMVGGVFGNWERYLQDNIDALRVNATQELPPGLLDADARKRLLKHLRVLTRLRPTFGLSHGDLSLDNVVVADDGGVAIIDWGCACAHIVPHYDFGVILDESAGANTDEFQALLRGYGMSAREFENIADEVLALQLLVAFDKARWAWMRSRSRLLAHTQKLQALLANVN